jgi:hypothetical protein
LTTRRLVVAQPPTDLTDDLEARLVPEQDARPACRRARIKQSLASIEETAA